MIPSYQDLDGLRGESGQGYGHIPYDLYLRKIATSDVEIDSLSYENHARKVLADLSCDKPAFASDEPRYDVGQQQRLAYRYAGSRYEDDPYLPDGTFLDHEFLEHDTRGVDGQPNMRWAAEQSRSRQFKFYKDSDNSVPERGITPSGMVNLIKSGFHGVRARLKIFGGSLEADTYCESKKKIGAKTEQELDAKRTILSEAIACNRRDPTAELSNDPTIAFRHSTPDHRFQIAKYGLNKASRAIADDEAQLNRMQSSVQKREFLTTEAGNKALAQTIVRLSKDKSLVNLSSDSNKQSNRPQSQPKTMKRDEAKLSAARDQSRIQITNISRKIADNRKLANMVVADRYSKILTAANKDQVRLRKSDLRSSVQESGAKENFTIQLANKQGIVKGKNVRNAISSEKRNDLHLTVKSYATMIPKRIELKEAFDTDAEFKDAKQGIITSKNQATNLKPSSNVDADGNYGEDFGSYEKTDVLARKNNRSMAFNSQNTADDSLELTNA